MFPGAVTAPEDHRERISRDEQGKKRAGGNARGKNFGEQGRQEDPQGGNPRLGNADTYGGDGSQHPFAGREGVDSVHLSADQMTAASMTRRMMPAGSREFLLFMSLSSWQAHCVC